MVFYVSMMSISLKFLLLIQKSSSENFLFIRPVFIPNLYRKNQWPSDPKIPKGVGDIKKGIGHLMQKIFWMPTGWKIRLTENFVLRLFGGVKKGLKPSTKIWIFMCKEIFWNSLSGWEELKINIPLKYFKRLTERKKKMT